MVMVKGCNQECRQRLGQVGWHYPTWRKYGGNMDFIPILAGSHMKILSRRKNIIEISGDDISVVALVVC